MSDLTIAAFQQVIRDRYEATDRRRGTPGTFMWFVEEVGELATALQECVRDPTPQRRADLAAEFADVLAWLATLANINDVDLAAAVTKYTREGEVRGVKH